ncbi:hypothetical protein EV645_3384 [Kribbella rubisoli]|uniref:Uncharacterized protein n=1 Tax=Kribbella rubisoli TaxID=3075929 RepID=A0A4V6MF44_9ACTN|nr:hypothetical protein [Kribbella rubisoli]RZU15846.1 hypothetical protein EV645_3384 [Kribbella rubisoli]
MLPPCEVELELDEPRPLELPLSSELLLDPELELLVELESSELLVEVDVVPVLSLFFDDTTATEIPVAPTPRTAVAIAAADARCNQRRRMDWGLSVLTMPQDSAEARQPHSKRRSSHRQVLLKAL